MTPTWDGHNPRWVLYCQERGYPNPDAALEAERKQWPGGVMCGFVLWINEGLRQYKAARNLPPNEPISDQGGFTEFLRARQAAGSEAQPHP